MKRFVAFFVFAAASALFLGGCQSTKETAPYGVTGEERQSISDQTLENRDRAKGVHHDSDHD